jgi:hypothetical protein
MTTCTKCFGTKRYSGEPCNHCEGTGTISKLQLFNDNLVQVAHDMSYHKVQNKMIESAIDLEQKAFEYGISSLAFMKAHIYNEFDYMFARLRKLSPLMQFVLIEWNQFDPEMAELPIGEAGAT